MQLLIKSTTHNGDPETHQKSGRSQIPLQILQLWSNSKRTSDHTPNICALKSEGHPLSKIKNVCHLISFLFTWLIYFLNPIPHGVCLTASEGPIRHIFCRINQNTFKVDHQWPSREKKTISSKWAELPQFLLARFIFWKFDIFFFWTWHCHTKVIF